MRKKYLLASDFDQTLSFNDSGIVLSELIGVNDFKEKVNGLEKSHLVQQGGELAYLLLHDPQFRVVRREHLIEVGKRIRLKNNIKIFTDILTDGIPGYEFKFFVVSAAPEEVIQSALEGIIPADHIIGTKFNYDASSGEIQSTVRVTAGYGKVAALDMLQSKHKVSSDNIVYVGDGSSDIHVMLHVNRRNGFTIAVSESEYIGQIAKRTILSDDAISVVIPILEDIIGWNDQSRIRTFFESRGLQIQEWEQVITDYLTIRQSPTFGHEAVIKFPEASNG